MRLSCGVKASRLLSGTESRAELIHLIRSPVGVFYERVDDSESNHFLTRSSAGSRSGPTFEPFHYLTERGFNIVQTLFFFTDIFVSYNE